MTDWSTIASLATAGGTLTLAIATFSSVRSSSRTARIAQQSYMVGMRPFLMPSQFTDPTQKVNWADGRSDKLLGGHGTALIEDDVIYLLMSLRNAGSGIAIIQGWKASAFPVIATAVDQFPVEQFHAQSRDLYIPPGTVGFWQGAIRDTRDPDFEGVHDAITNRERFSIQIMYGDHEGGQRTISLFSLDPRADDSGEWTCAVSKHWYLDRPNPR
jgi:hypothetical protein